MDNKIINEASLNQDLDMKLKKGGIIDTSDDIEDLRDRNAIIDTSNFEKDSNFIDNLIAVCSKISDYDKKIVNIPV